MKVTQNSLELLITLLAISKSFFIMSIFDPQGLYIHHKTNTHRGQVMQKRPQNPASTISEREVSRAKIVLKNYFYKIYPTLPFDPQLYYFDVYTGCTGFNVPYSDLVAKDYSMDVHFSDIWDLANINMQESLRIPVRDVDSFIFRVQLTSIVFESSLNGTCTWGLDTFFINNFEANLTCIDSQVIHGQGYQFTIYQPSNHQGAMTYNSLGQSRATSYINRPPFPGLSFFANNQIAFLETLRQYSETPLPLDSPINFLLLDIRRMGSQVDPPQSDEFIHCRINFQIELFIKPKQS